jgi:hypothetical protein
MHNYYAYRYMGLLSITPIGLALPVWSTLLVIEGRCPHSLWGKLCQLLCQWRTKFYGRLPKICTRDCTILIRVRSTQIPEAAGFLPIQLTEVGLHLFRGSVQILHIVLRD